MVVFFSTNLENKVHPSNIVILDALSRNASPLNIVSFLVKLHDKNYILWHKQLLCFIMAYRLKGFVDGSLSRLSPFS